MNYSNYFRIYDYYKKFVIPLNPKRYFCKNQEMMVCPLHNDHDPSMGIIKSSKGEEQFHCFGCGRWGDVVDLHIGVIRRWKNITLSRQDAVRDLCNMFGLDYSKIPSEDSSVDDYGAGAESALDASMDKFSIYDYKNMITDGKRQGKGIAYYNTLMMVMVSQLKS